MHRTRMTSSLRAAGILLLLLGSPAAPHGAAADTPGDHVLRIQQAYYPDSLDPQKSSGTFVSAILSTPTW